MQQLEQRTKPLQSTVIEKEYETLEQIEFNSLEWFKQIRILKKKYVRRIPLAPRQS